MNLTVTQHPYCQALSEQRSKSAHKLNEIGDQWRTPDNIFWGINAMFGPLVLDLFSDGENAKCNAFYTAEDNALTQDWSERLKELNGAAFANPPYSRAAKFDDQYITGMRYIMEHVSAMREKGGRYVFLIKAATSEVWWPEDADHIAFIRGRIGFDLPEWFIPADDKQVPSGAFFAGAVAVFDKNWRGPAMSYISRKDLEAQGDAFIAQIRREAMRLLPQMQQQNIPEIISTPDEVGPVDNQAQTETAASELSPGDETLPLTQKDILEQSGVEVWACVCAAFGNEAEYTFNQSKYAHTWASDSIDKPEFVTVSKSTIARAQRIIKEHQVGKGLKEWVVHQQIESGVSTEILERLECVFAEEGEYENGLELEAFLHALDSIDLKSLSNIRHIRAHLRVCRDQREDAA
ncbi:phage N-6-adenine-methyltransferase [Buttiauxella sp. WJP83]|uniref:phage N-6-adenine-methyltransferase n=1 Tax=Buttiauxella sp. WJP83 TaxID=2986951 RepID=UPI0022DD26D5|nr:phage N-6-adenine-methyltransferase [Buttiauxella sp. WJP83]WBM69154.1 phage N-6-adenine-methyltransferase [Buttiauxella sp. WJP83]